MRRRRPKRPGLVRRVARWKARDAEWLAAFEAVVRMTPEGEQFSLPPGFPGWDSPIFIRALNAAVDSIERVSAALTGVMDRLPGAVNLMSITTINERRATLGLPPIAQADLAQLSARNAAGLV